MYREKGKKNPFWEIKGKITLLYSHEMLFPSKTPTSRRPNGSFLCYIYDPACKYIHRMGEKERAAASLHYSGVF